jgi:hypothetical protein
MEMSTMDTVTTYPTGLRLVNSIPLPLKGRYLKRSLKNRHLAAFVGADLVSGEAQLVEPTLAQAAFITGSEVMSVWWAMQRQDHREEIIAGLMPLVPSRHKKAYSVPAAKAGIDDVMLFDIISKVGVDHTLAIAAAVEAQAHH